MFMEDLFVDLIHYINQNYDTTKTPSCEVDCMHRICTSSEGPSQNQLNFTSTTGNILENQCINREYSTHTRPAICNTYETPYDQCINETEGDCLRSLYEGLTYQCNHETQEDCLRIACDGPSIHYDCLKTDQTLQEAISIHGISTSSEGISCARPRTCNTREEQFIDCEYSSPSFSKCTTRPAAGYTYKNPYDQCIDETQDDYFKFVCQELATDHHSECSSPISDIVDLIDTLSQNSDSCEDEKAEVEEVESQSSDLKIPQEVTASSGGLQPQKTVEEPVSPKLEEPVIEVPVPEKIKKTLPKKSRRNTVTKSTEVCPEPTIAELNNVNFVKRLKKLLKTVQKKAAQVAEDLETNRNKMEEINDQIVELEEHNVEYQILLQKQFEYLRRATGAVEWQSNLIRELRDKFCTQENTRVLPGTLFVNTLKVNPWRCDPKQNLITIRNLRQIVKHLRENEI